MKTEAAHLQLFVHKIATYLLAYHFPLHTYSCVYVVCANKMGMEKVGRTVYMDCRWMVV